jgi:hypothetical protein
MTQREFTPDIQKIQSTSLKFREIFQKMDAEIIILDDLIAQFDEKSRNSQVYKYSFKEVDMEKDEINY